jgi:hypothetical protein
MLFKGNFSIGTAVHGPAAMPLPADTGTRELAMRLQLRMVRNRSRDGKEKEHARGVGPLSCEQPKIPPDPGQQALQDRVQLLGIGDGENEK